MLSFIAFDLMSDWLIHSYVKLTPYEFAIVWGESWPTAAIPVGNPYCSCELTRVRPRGTFIAINLTSLVAGMLIGLMLTTMQVQKRSAFAPPFACLPFKACNFHVCLFLHTVS